jgi:predicted esterase
MTLEYFAFLAQSDGTYIIKAPESSSLCVDLNDSAQLVQNYCLPTASQHWLGTFNADGTVTITNQQTGQCIGATSATGGLAAGFTGVTCNGTAAQEFTIVAAQYYTPPVISPASVLPTIPAAATVGQWQAGMYQGLPYRIMFPSGYDPVHHYYPLALFLHGEGERGTDNLRQLINGMDPLTTDLDFRANVPMILVAPQCPVTDSWGDAVLPDPSATEALAVQLVQMLVSSLAVDPQRVSVTGLSMGGFGAWDMINRYPAVFAAAAPIASAGNLADVPNLVQVPLLAVHGGADTIVPPIFDEAMYAAIHALGGPMLYFEVPGGGHDVWDGTYSLTAFWYWMYSQQHV